MRSLDLGGDAQRHRVTAANRAEAEKVRVAVGEVIPGKTAKIGFRAVLVSLRFLLPLIVDAIEVHHFRLQALASSTAARLRMPTGASSPMMRAASISPTARPSN